MTNFWVHVNHPNDKAVIHADGGCAWVIKAAGRVRTGESYGPVHGEKNGYWRPFSTLDQAEAYQRSTGKSTQDRCRTGSCQARFP